MREVIIVLVYHDEAGELRIIELHVFLPALTTPMWGKDLSVFNSYRSKQATPKRGYPGEFWPKQPLNMRGFPPGLFDPTTFVREGYFPPNAEQRYAGHHFERAARLLWGIEDESWGLLNSPLWLIANPVARSVLASLYGYIPPEAWDRLFDLFLGNDGMFESL